MADFGTYQGRPPYLTVWDLISLGWLYYPIIALLFVAFSLWIASQSATSGVEDAKKALIAACGTAEKSATVAASLPRWLAQSTNDELNNAIRESLEASHEALNVVLTIVESIIGFVIDTFKSLQLCLFQFVIRGTLAVLIQITLTTKQFLSGALNGIADGIQASISATTSGVNTAIDAINSTINRFNNAIPDLFGAIPDIPTISRVTLSVDVSSIRNFAIPDTFSNQLISLNSSIPTLDQLRGDLQNIVAVPFNLLKAEMNTTFAGINTPNVTVPLPPLQDVQFCNDLDTSFIDELGKDLVRIAYIGIGVLVAIAVVIFIVNGFLTWIRWKLLNRHVAEIKERWAAGNIDKDSIRERFTGAYNEKAPVKSQGAIQLTPRALYTLNNELSHSFAYKVLDIFDSIPFLRLSHVSHDRLAWYLSYIFSPSALVCLLVGAFGLIAIGIQLLAIKPIQRKVAQEVQEVVQTVANSLGGRINAAMATSSATYATSVNSQLESIDNAINAQFFSWIANTTSVLNNTIVAYYDDLENGINGAFNGTLFASPMVEFVRCIIGNKIAALEGAIAFLQANLHIPIPRVSPDVLLLSDNTLLQVSTPVANAAVGGEGDGVFGRLVDRYLQALRGELITFGIILGVWGFICLMGMVILLWDVIANWNRTPKREMGSVEMSEKGRGSVEGTLAATTPWWQRLKLNRGRSKAHPGDVENMDKASTIGPSPLTTPVNEEPHRTVPVRSR